MSGMDKNTRRSPDVPGKPDDLGTSSEIGRKLKQYYDELVTDQVPDRFMELLKTLEGKETGSAQVKD